MSLSIILCFFRCVYSEHCTLYIADEPTIILPSHVVKLEHTSFNLTCRIAVDPNSHDNPPILTWHDIEGNILASNNGTQDNYVILQFVNAHRNMSGIYECFAYDNSFNYSDTTTLYIQCKETKLVI